MLKRSTSFAEPMQSGVRWSMPVITVSSTEPAAGNMTATPSNRHGIAQFSAFTRRKRAPSTYMRAAAASKQHPPKKKILREYHVPPVLPSESLPPAAATSLAKGAA